MNEPLHTLLDDMSYWVSWKLGVGKIGEAVKVVVMVEVVGMEEVVGMVEVVMTEFKSFVSPSNLFHLSSASSLLRTSNEHKTLAVESKWVRVTERVS